MKINRTLLIIVTNMRSGSTFVGRMFDQNDRAMYVFEPFWPDVDVLDRPWSEKDNRRAKLLQSFSTCEFNSAIPLQFLSELSKGRRRWTRTYSTSLTSNQFCHKTAPSVNSRRVFTTCSYDSKIMEEYCLAKQIVVWKVIRLANISHLRPVHEQSIITDHDTDHLPAALHILHLVRDPRGTLNSRLKIGQVRLEYHSLHTTNSSVTMVEMVRFSAHRLCKQIQYTMNVGKQDPWLKDKYHRVLFEDIASDPIMQMTQLFHQYGLEMTSNVLQWIKVNTHDYEHKKSGSMAMKRDSKSVVSSWNEMLKSVKGREYIRAIEEECKDVMRDLGYGLTTAKYRLS
jgi:chondroitin 6-sulfotransferase 3/keratan sulfate 6-sulfotransferase 1